MQNILVIALLSTFISIFPATAEDGSLEFGSNNTLIVRDRLLIGNEAEVLGEDGISFSNAPGDIANLTPNGNFLTTDAPISIAGEVDANSIVFAGDDSQQLTANVAAGGCAWVGRKCSCFHDPSGSTERHLLLGVDCNNNVITDLQILSMVRTSRNTACPAATTAANNFACDIYSIP